MNRNNDNFSMEKVLRLANSPAGKELMDIMKHADSQTVAKARQQAEQGDYQQAKQTLAHILKSPHVQALIKEMEKQNG